jgi:hypothetical protein
LEKEVKALKKQAAENAWAKDYLEIWKLQSLYSHLYHVGRNSEVPSLFAQKTPGVTMELEDSGVYEGIKSITYFWNKVFDVDRMHRSQGFLAVHMTVNPVIEINRKGTLAKGLWHSHGVCSFASIAGNPLNKPDKPVTYHMPYSRYRINVFQPSPPEPFKD